MSTTAAKRYSTELRVSVSKFMNSRGIQHAKGAHIAVLDALPRELTRGNHLDIEEDQLLALCREHAFRRKGPSVSDELDRLDAWFSEKEDVIVTAIIGLLRKQFYPIKDHLLDALVGPYLDRARSSRRYSVRVERLPWDISSYPEQTDQRHPWASYETLGDFLDEPTGNTQATFCSGSGFAAETYADEMFCDVMSVIHGEAKRITQEDLRKALSTDFSPDELEGMPSIGEILDYLPDDLSDAYCDQLENFTIEEDVKNLPFREVLQRIRPQMMFLLASHSNVASLRQ